MLSPDHSVPIAVFDAAALRVALDRVVEQAGTRAAAAEALDISGTYLNDVLAERREIGALTGRLGYRPLTLYIPDGSPPISPTLAVRVIERLRRQRMAQGGAA